MSDIEDDNSDKIVDTLTPEEQEKIESIHKVSFPEPEKIPPQPYSIWSILGLAFGGSGPVSAAAVGTQSAPHFDIKRVIGINKVVTINNISGKHAYVILTIVPIKSLNSVGVGGGGGNMDVSFEDKGEYKAQKLSIPNNTSSKYELDNSKFYCTLFLNVDGVWKKSWENRKFNGRKFDINILERHVAAALDKDNIPDF